MKNLILILLLLFTSVGFSQTIFDFEGAPPTFGDFNGSFTQVIPNPDATGINTSANVAENTVPANAAFAGVNIVASIDLTTNKAFKMDVWSSVANTPVLLKLEGGPNPPVERLVSLTGTNAWEEIVFDFSSEGPVTYDSVTVFMNFNMVDPNVQTYFWDNLEQFAPPPSLPLNFEGAPPAFGDFNGSFTQVIANPDPTGVNTTANVAENTVPANAAFAGVNIVVGVDITTDKFFRMDVWSPVANTPVLLKLEGGPNPPVERLVNLTGTNAWEEVIFDFSSEGALTFDSVTVFMNFNMVDPNTQTYFWDNLELFSPAVPNPSLPITFEGGQLPVFGDFNGSSTQVIPNPDATGVNTSANVAENMVPANAGAAGVNFPVNLIDLSTDKGFTLDVWSPLANTPVLLKLESTTGPPHERLVNLTTTGAWEEVSFDFSGLTNETFDSVTLFMSFNQPNGAPQTYFWDNLEQVSLAPTAPSLPITFEGGQLPAFGDFNGSSTQVIANPDPTGFNTSPTVAENTVPANAAFAGVNFPVNLIDLSVDKGFRMDVWSPLANTPVLLKLESTTGPPHERLVNLTTTGAWEEIKFDFSALTNETFDSVTIFMNFNQTDGASQTYFWDNLRQVSLDAPPPSLPITFEGANLPVFGDFNGSSTQVITNPDASGINTSATVAENVVPANAGAAGVSFPVGLIDVSADKGFTMDVWSPLVNTPVLLKLESSTGPPQERLVNLTTTNAWEEVFFDFSALTNETFDTVTIFMNFNQPNADPQTYFWDNLEQVNIPPPPLASLPIDFEGPAPTFIDFNGSFTQIIANPDASGVNTSANVAENTVPANAAFAGVNIPVNTVDITDDKVFTMQVWSSLANTPVLLKLENSTTGVNVERQANMTTTSAWEELTFDFGTEPALTFDSVTVFMNFNMVDPATQIYFWDNLIQTTTTSPLVSLPINFEAGQLPSFGDFNGSFTQVIANPDASGVNTSANVAENTVPADAAFAGVNIPVNTIDITDDKGFTMQVWSSVVNTPVLLKLENSTTGDEVERLVTMTTTSAWEDLTFDFSTEPALTFDSVTVFMNFNVIDPAAQIYYWDNLTQINIAVSGDPVELPVDFENTDAFYDIEGFEGADSAVEANPDPSGINTSATVVRTIKTVGAQFFAGTSLELDSPIDFSDSEQISIKTWSPKADIPVRLKLENADGSEFVELDVNTTVMDQWEELTWDFTGMTAGIDFVRVVVFFEFIVDLAGDGSTYYYDDIEVATILGINDASTSLFTAFPNPVTSQWNLESNELIKSVEIYNMVGQLIMKTTPNSQNYAIDLSQLNAGLYVAHVVTTTGDKSIKVIKN